MSGKLMSPWLTTVLLMGSTLERSRCASELDALADSFMRLRYIDEAQQYSEQEQTAGEGGVGGLTAVEGAPASADHL